MVTVRLQVKYLISSVTRVVVRLRGGKYDKPNTSFLSDAVYVTRINVEGFI